MLQEGDKVKSKLRYTDAVGLTGKVTGFQIGRVVIEWSDGITSSERAEYIEKISPNRE